jgi:thioredoxin 1
MDKVVELDTAQFKAAVLEAEQPVLVGFHAPGCEPCRTQGTILEDLARKLGGVAQVVRVDVARSPELAALLAVRTVPTIAIFRDGRIAARFVGLTASPTLAAALVTQLG